MIPIVLPQAPKALRPVSTFYPNIFALALWDFEQRYYCTLCQKQWSIPVLLNLARWDFAGSLEEKCEEHVLCQVDLDEHWLALGELLG